MKIFKIFGVCLASLFLLIGVNTIIGAEGDDQVTTPSESKQLFLEDWENVGGTEADPVTYMEARTNETTFKTNFKSWSTQTANDIKRIYTFNSSSSGNFTGSFVSAINNIALKIDGQMNVAFRLPKPYVFEDEAEKGTKLAISYKVKFDSSFNNSNRGNFIEIRGRNTENPSELAVVAAYAHKIADGLYANNSNRTGQYPAVANATFESAKIYELTYVIDSAEATRAFNIVPQLSPTPTPPAATNPPLPTIYSTKLYYDGLMPGTDLYLYGYMNGKDYRNQRDAATDNRPSTNVEFLNFSVPADTNYIIDDIEMYEISGDFALVSSNVDGNNSVIANEEIEVKFNQYINKNSLEDIAITKGGVVLNATDYQVTTEKNVDENKVITGTAKIKFNEPMDYDASYVITFPETFASEAGMTLGGAGETIEFTAVPAPSFDLGVEFKSGNSFGETPTTLAEVAGQRLKCTATFQNETEDRDVNGVVMAALYNAEGEIINCSYYEREFEDNVQEQDTVEFYFDIPDDTTDMEVRVFMCEDLSSIDSILSGDGEAVVLGETAALK